MCRLLGTVRQAGWTARVGVLGVRVVWTTMCERPYESCESQGVAVAHGRWRGGGSGLCGFSALAPLLPWAAYGIPRAQAPLWPLLVGKQTALTSDGVPFAASNLASSRS